MRALERMVTLGQGLGLAMSLLSWVGGRVVLVVLGGSVVLVVLGGSEVLAVLGGLVVLAKHLEA